MITSGNNEARKFLKVLETMYNIHTHFKFNTFDVVKYTKPTDDKLEENEFTFRLMTRQHNGPCDLDMFNSELKTKIEEQEMKQSGWSMQRFVKRTMCIHRFYPKGGCHVEFPFQSRFLLNINNNDNKMVVFTCLSTSS